MRYLSLSILFFIFLQPIISFSQEFKSEKIELKEDSVDYQKVSITYYDSYNPILGGDSVLFRNRIPFTGQFKESYPNGKLKHKGFYDKGRLIYYSNYYENGQLERNFRAKGNLKHQLEIFYENGTLMSHIIYFKGEVLKWEDFYSNGKMEFIEEFSKKLDHILLQMSFYSTGNPQTELILIDKKRLYYTSKEFFSTGIINEEGFIIKNRFVNEYQKDGKWLIFDETGKLTCEENYVKGQLISEMNY